MTSKDTLRVMVGVTRAYMDNIYKSLCIQTCTPIDYRLNLIDTAKEINRMYQLIFFDDKPQIDEQYDPTK